MKSAAAGVVIGGLIGVMMVGGGACGGAQHPTEQEKRLALENEITSLWTQIREWRREGHMVLDPAQASLMAVGLQKVQDERRICPDNHDVPKACNEVCNLSDAICDDAEQICTIADQLGKDDEYAQSKCASAKASCREAKQKCCGCAP